MHSALCDIHGPRGERLCHVQREVSRAALGVGLWLAAEEERVGKTHPGCSRLGREHIPQLTFYHEKQTGLCSPVGGSCCPPVTMGREARHP